VRTAAAALLLFLAGCGKPEPPDEWWHTEQYREWKGGQILRQMPAAKFAPEVPGRIDVEPPASRSKHADDFCELFLNGYSLTTFRVAKMADGRYPVCGTDVLLLTGPNWIDMWDTSSNRHYRHQIDTREGTLFTFVPTPEGYDLRQVKKE
jgi:hypothetical protein